MDPFLALEVKWSRDTSVHKDSQNSHCATLLCNLSEGAPGGTWIENAAGNVWMQCPDDRTRCGSVLRGQYYRFSARTLWHAAIPDVRDRLVLVGWVPAGWTNLGTTHVQELRVLGFSFPDLASDERSQLSLWSTRAVVQKSIVESLRLCQATARTQWATGLLRSPQQLHICLSSDEEEEEVVSIPKCTGDSEVEICIDISE